MYRKSFLILMILLIIATPIYALEWQPVNYSSPETINESGLTIDQFNNLSKSDWSKLFGGKKRVNFAFSATDSNGNDITNSINPNLSINVDGLSSNQIVSFDKVILDTTNTKNNTNTIPDLSQYSNVVYVNADMGNDSFEGSKTSPVQTLTKAMEIITPRNNEAIYLTAGTYSLRSLNDLYNIEYIDVIGEGLNTKIIVEGATNQYDGFLGEYISVDLYGLYFELSDTFSENAVKDKNAFRIVLNNNDPYLDFEIHNCAFNSNNQLSREEFFHFDSTYAYVPNGNKAIIKNSVSDIQISGGLSTSNTGNVDTVLLENSATEGVKLGVGDYKTSLIGATFDENYNITSSGWKNTGTGTNPDGSQANIGVYGGQYSW
jgi:hypothetical protein